MLNNTAIAALMNPLQHIVLTEQIKKLNPNSMEKISLKHPKESFNYTISRMLERAAFYGFRALLLIYLTGEIIQMERTESILVLSWVITSLVFSQIIGAALGDLKIGNKKSIVLGGILQAIGAFILCIPSMQGLYIGLIFIVLGNGLYVPNHTANFAKIYLNNKLMDAGFTLLQLGINLGAFLGVFLIGIVGEKYGIQMGFTLSGILILLSIVPILLSKEKIEIIENSLAISKNNRNINRVIGFLVVGLFWVFYSSSSQLIYYEIDSNSVISSLSISQITMNSLPTYILMPLGIIAIFSWTYFYCSSFWKLLLGILLMAISMVLLLFISEIPTQHHVFPYLGIIILIGIAETLISPMLHSILTQYSNPKYLAIIISLSFLPIKLIATIFVLFQGEMYENPELGIIIGILTMLFMAIGLWFFMRWNKAQTRQESKT